MKVVISVGGSILYEKHFNYELALGLKGVLKSGKYKIVAGGGRLARNLISQLNFLKEEDKHRVGIMATKINAFILSKILNFKFLDIDPRLIGLKNFNTVSGGYKPGWSTDVDAAIIAKYWKADVFLNMTNVKYVYNKDPRKYKNAKPFKEISFDELIEIQGNKYSPGMHYVLDPRAVKILKRSRIQAYIFSGIGNLKRILEGRDFVGTKVF